MADVRTAKNPKVQINADVGVDVDVSIVGIDADADVSIGVNDGHGGTCVVVDSGRALCRDTNRNWGFGGQDELGGRDLIEQRTRGRQAARVGLRVSTVEILGCWVTGLRERLYREAALCDGTWWDFDRNCLLDHRNGHSARRAAEVAVELPWEDVVDLEVHRHLGFGVQVLWKHTWKIQKKSNRAKKGKDDLR